MYPESPRFATPTERSVWLVLRDLKRMDVSGSTAAD